MRAHIPRRPGIRVLAGDASTLPLPDGSADGAWLSLVLHHIPDLQAAAVEIRRVLRPGAPVLIRQGFPGRVERNEFVRWFPETERMVDTNPSVEETCRVFAAAGFSRDALERRLAIYILTAGRACPSLREKRITLHVLRHTSAMRLLHAGVDITVIALWLGHEQVETTQIYLHADLALKEKALARTTPVNTSPGRYQPPDTLLAFLEAL